MGISKASASRCVHDVAECLCEMAQDWIKFPTASGDINVNKYDLLLLYLRFPTTKKKKKMRNDLMQRSIMNESILYRNRS